MEVELTPPSTLFASRRFDASKQRLVIGVGGSRSPSVEAFGQCYEVCRLLAEQGGIIASGGVPGIDLAAHLAALDHHRDRMKTIVALANSVRSGLLGHPWGSELIDCKLRESGLYLSEYESDVSVTSAEFRERLLQRDRIVTAICDAFIAFECSEDSATVDTAKRAWLQHKPVFVVRPQKTTTRRGVNQLLDCGIAEPLDPERDDLLSWLLGRRRLDAVAIAG